MADRTVLNSATAGAITGDDYMDNIKGHIDTLYDNISLIPATVTNSGNDYTLTLDPVLDDDVVNGMTFLLSPNANNTGAVQIRAASDKPYYDCVKASGEALDNNDFDSDTVYLIAFFGGEFRILSVAEAADTGAVLYRNEYTTTTVWNKPSGLPTNALAIIELWGGGGGGSASSQRTGGGGGAYNFKVMLVSDLGASETVTIGAGGSTGSAGGETAFGSHFSAFGGGGGDNTSSSSGGGGGGGQISVGEGGNSAGGGTGGAPAGGYGKRNATSLVADETEALANGNSGGGGGSSGGGGGAAGGGAVFNSAGDGINGGGGGAGAGVSAAGSGNGGNSIYGGGGGGGGNQSSGIGNGGTSVFGGNGGNAAQPGVVPGGGGGAGASGASGKAIITIIA